MSTETYTEKRSALRWPVLVRGLYLPGAIILLAIVLGVAVNPLWFLVVLVTPLFGPFLIGISLLYRNWPTGARPSITRRGRSAQPRGPRCVACRSSPIAGASST